MRNYVIAIIDGNVECEPKSIKQLLEEVSEGQDVTIVEIQTSELQEIVQEKFLISELEKYLEILEKPIIPELLEYCEFTAEPKELGQMVKVREKKNQILKSTTNYVEPYIPKRRYYRRGNIKK